MKIIIISNPTDLQKEHDIINALFENGMDYFHLRKPEHSRSEFESFLNGINPKFYKRISIHSNIELIQKYNLGGIHIPEAMRNDSSIKEVIKASQKKGIRVSTSVHEKSDLSAIKMFDTVFLSPVFDSISKEGYQGLSNEKIIRLLKILKANKKTEVIALGGIEANNINKIAEMDFDGAALLGAIWKNPEEAIHNFKTIKEMVKPFQKL